MCTQSIKLGVQLVGRAPQATRADTESRPNEEEREEALTRAGQMRRLRCSDTIAITMNGLTHA